LINEGIESIY